MDTSAGKSIAYMKSILWQSKIIFCIFLLNTKLSFSDQQVPHFGRIKHAVIHIDLHCLSFCIFSICFCLFYRGLLRFGQRPQWSKFDFIFGNPGYLSFLFSLLEDKVNNNTNIGFHILLLDIFNHIIIVFQIVLPCGVHTSRRAAK